MKKLLILSAALSALTLTACTRVEQGYAGIKIQSYGSNAATPQPLGPGSYFLSPGERIVEYPTYSKTYTYTSSSDEGKQADESFSFLDKNGVVLHANIGVQYHTDPSMAPQLYVKYRTDYEGLIAGPLRNEIRDRLVTYSVNYTVDEMRGPKQQELLAKVQDDTAAFFKPYGFVVERLFLAGHPSVDQRIQDQINNRVANEQEAVAEQAKVAITQAQAAQRVAEAEGEAKANDTLGASLRTNPEVLRQKAIDKWDGHLPQVSGSGATPFIDLKGQ